MSEATWQEGLREMVGQMNRRHFLSAVTAAIAGMKARIWERDDTAWLQARLDAATAEKPFVLNGGTYRISRTIRLPNAPVYEMRNCTFDGGGVGGFCINI